MLETICDAARRASRSSRRASRRIKINPEKIGLLIGPGGKNIRAIQEETGTKIDIAGRRHRFDRLVRSEGTEKAIQRIMGLTQRDRRSSAARSTPARSSASCRTARSSSSSRARTAWSTSPSCPRIRRPRQPGRGCRQPGRRDHGDGDRCRAERESQPFPPRRDHRRIAAAEEQRSRARAAVAIEVRAGMAVMWSSAVDGDRDRDRDAPAPRRGPASSEVSALRADSDVSYRAVTSDRGEGGDRGRPAW